MEILYIFQILIQTALRICHPNRAVSFPDPQSPIPIPSYTSYTGIDTTSRESGMRSGLRHSTAPSPTFLAYGKIIPDIEKKQDGFFGKFLFLP